MPIKLIEQAGPGAFARLQQAIHEDVLSVIPPNMAFYKDNDPCYANARLTLATCELEGNVGYLWAYVKTNGRAERPFTDFWIELIVPGESETRLIPAITGDDPIEDTYVAISDVYDLIKAENAMELYAFVAFAFMSISALMRRCAALAFDAQKRAWPLQLQCPGVASCIPWHRTGFRFLCLHTRYARSSQPGSCTTKTHSPLVDILAPE